MAWFLSLVWSKLRLCSANHRSGYFMMWIPILVRWHFILNWPPIWIRNTQPICHPGLSWAGFIDTSVLIEILQIHLSKLGMGCVWNSQKYPPSLRSLQVAVSHVWVGRSFLVVTSDGWRSLGCQAATDVGGMRNVCGNSPGGSSSVPGHVGWPTD